MKITLETNLPNNSETLEDVLKIVSYAKLKFDINLRVTEYCFFTKTQLSALNTISLETIIEEINEELENE
jgi:hypothetical protein